MSQFAYLLRDHSSRRNLTGLLKYMAFMAGVVVAFSISFHYLMKVEGQHHSWVTGLYWTLTVMSTLGFGDITFQGDLGRAFSVLVLLCGIVLLLIVLPFAFIRFFYAPWLEAQIRTRAPRAVPETARAHVIVCQWDTIARGLARRFAVLDIPYYVIEPDPAAAALLYEQGIPVVLGDRDSASTYAAMRVSAARAVFANLDDPANTNVTLTVREVSANVELISTVEHAESVDVLELAGATHVLPLKQRLGEQLANRVNARHCETHVIGQFKGLWLAELPVHGTPLVDRTIRDSRLRETAGVNIVGVWARGQLLPAMPDFRLTPASVPVVVGTEEQLAALNRQVVDYDVNANPVLVLGGGKVGRATARALRRKGVPVHLIEHSPAIAARARACADRVFVGEAAEKELLIEAGIQRAPSVVLTTNDDAMNIYLCIYCRRLNPELRIVSRITHERNVEAIHRAGADFVLSYSSLGQESTVALLQGRELLFVGEGVRFFTIKVPGVLAGQTLRDSGIRARTGLNVVAIENNGTDAQANPPPETVMEAGAVLLVIGTEEQRTCFKRMFS